MFLVACLGVDGEDTFGGLIDRSDLGPLSRSRTSWRQLERRACERALRLATAWSKVGRGE